MLNRFTPEERVMIGVHTCPGGDRDSVHSADVPYTDLLPSLFQMNAGYFLIQLASERDRDSAYKSIGENIRKDANGVKQVAYVGVTVTQSPRVETAEEVCNQSSQPPSTSRRISSARQTMRFLTLQHR